MSQVWLNPHGKVKVGQKDKMRKTAYGGLLLYFKINKNASGTKVCKA